ncbi:MAG: ABC transporter permease, partial [Acidobacteria bacterium]|nr:ABC transporter permease [Acidobacteriota bacterium]
GWQWYTVSPANFLDWSREGDLFEAISAYSLYSDTGYNLSGGAEPERVVSTAATAAFFDVFRVPPLLGRTFAPGEDQPGNDQVVVLSYGLWQRRFGGDPKVLDRSLYLDGVAHRVVGVMGPDFRYPAETELWLPLAFSPLEAANRTVRPLFVVARLADGVEMDRAQARMTAVGKRLEEAYPASNSGFGVVIHSLHERVVGGVRPAMLILLGAVSCLLLIAAANVANLLLARAASRGEEMAIRQALGAGRRHLVRQLLTEGLVLALLGGTFGLFLAMVGGGALLSFAPRGLPRLGEIGLGGGTALITLVVSIATALLFSLAPLLGLSQARLAAGLRSGGRSGGEGRGRLRQALVVSQVAFALLLLVAAGLTARSLLAVQRQEVGFEPQGLLTLQLALPQTKYPGADAQGLFFDDLLARASALPGVRSAAVTSWLPFASVPMDWDFFVKGRPPEVLDDAVTAGFRAVSPGYFETMGIPVRRGRSFEATDQKDSVGVVVINEAMARRFWAGQDPIGEHLILGDLVKGMLPGLPLEAEVVGVVGDVKQTALELPVAPAMYVPSTQYGFGTMFLVVRGSVAPQALAESLRREIAKMDPAQPIFDARTQEERLTASVAQPRLTVVLLAAFALLALVLAAVGIYGVIAYTMNRRQREIGLRMALGASRHRILGWVLVKGLIPALGGLGIGLLAALALGWGLRSLLFEVSPADPLTYLGVGVLLMAVSALACLIPALRTSRLDPQKALRQD